MRVSHSRRVVVAALALIALATLVSAAHSAASTPFAPVQPIAFSHVVHVQGDKLKCEMCHSTARRSPFAGIAALERCMGCHRIINPENPEIARVRGFWNAGRPIPWVKVYVLPRFVRFTHDAHVRAHVSCATCHGQVEQMERVARVTPLTMGWCVGCHRERHASDDCLTCHY